MSKNMLLSFDNFSESVGLLGKNNNKFAKRIYNLIDP